MHNHFDTNLNLRELIGEANPSWILELGVGDLNNTGRLHALGRKLVCVDIGNPPEGGFDGMEYHQGLSWEVIPELPPVEFAIVDTDHNGKTLMMELTALDANTVPGAVITVHDLVSFGGRNGVMRGGYHPLKREYPTVEYEEGLSYGEAFRRFISDTQWEVVRQTDESQGAAALRRA